MKPEKQSTITQVSREPRPSPDGYVSNFPGEKQVMATNGIHTVRNTGTTSEINGHTPDSLIEVPVLIIGGGPSGLLQSYLLSRLGVRSLIVERYPERLGAPKAHALSPRSLEICRQFGLDVRAIRSLGTKRKDAYWVNFLTSLSGESVGILPYERMDPEVLEDTPEMIHNIPQPVFEQFVADRLTYESNADIRKGVSFVSLRQTEDRVVTTVEERATGHKFKIKSGYVIACDGAKSKVRESLGIESDGEDSCKFLFRPKCGLPLSACIRRNDDDDPFQRQPPVCGWQAGWYAPLAL